MTVHVARATRGNPGAAAPANSAAGTGRPGAHAARAGANPARRGGHGEPATPSGPGTTPTRRPRGLHGAADAGRSGAYGRKVFHRPHPAHRSCHMGAAAPHAEQRCGTPNA